MAGITREPNGRRTIRFVAPDGKKRPKIRLGKVSQKQAEAVKVHVERLIASSIMGHVVDDETARWVANLDTVLADKLARVGLIPGRRQATLQAFLDRYFASRIDVKPATLTVWGHTRRNLIAFFGPDKPLREITRGDADEWRLSLAAEGLSESTIRKRCGFAKQFLSAAVKHELIPSNPFAELKSGDLANPSRYYFVTREEADKVVEACPDAQWRLLFALSRYGGLRCPSEHLSLRWGDVDWERDRMVVTSPKTEHHVGGGSRVVPLFPELRRYLEECFDLAEPGEEYVITRYRRTNSNLRTQLLRIIAKAGLERWPKLFQNLRSTRETELADQFPIQVVCEWIGNTEAIAAKHYLQVTEDHFAKAVGEGGQKAGQQPAVSPRIGSQTESAADEEPPVLQGNAGECDYLHGSQVERRGLEPPTSALRTQRSPG